MSVTWRHSGPDHITRSGNDSWSSFNSESAWRPSSMCPWSVWWCVVSDRWRTHPRAHAAVPCDHQQPWRRGCRRNLGEPHRRLHPPLRHGQRCHGDLHPGSLRSSEREPSLSDCGEYGGSLDEERLCTEQVLTFVSLFLGQFLVCMVMGSLITLRVGINAIIARPQVTTPSLHSISTVACIIIIILSCDWLSTVSLCVGRLRVWCRRSSGCCFHWTRPLQICRP